jgi:hypothetical protein
MMLMFLIHDNSVTIIVTTRKTCEIDKHITLSILTANVILSLLNTSKDVTRNECRSTKFM